MRQIFLPMLPWVQNLPEVGSPIESQARFLDAEAERLQVMINDLEKERAEFKRSIKSKWTKDEIIEARRTKPSVTIFFRNAK